MLCRPPLNIAIPAEEPGSLPELIATLFFFRQLQVTDRRLQVSGIPPKADPPSAGNLLPVAYNLLPVRSVQIYTITSN